MLNLLNLDISRILHYSYFNFFTLKWYYVALSSMPMMIFQCLFYFLFKYCVDIAYLMHELAQNSGNDLFGDTSTTCTNTGPEIAGTIIQLQNKGMCNIDSVIRHYTKNVEETISVPSNRKFPPNPIVEVK